MEGEWKLHPVMEQHKHLLVLIGQQLSLLLMDEKLSFLHFSGKNLTMNEFSHLFGGVFRRVLSVSDGIRRHLRLQQTFS